MDTVLKPRTMKKLALFSFLTSIVLAVAGGTLSLYAVVQGYRQVCPQIPEQYLPAAEPYYTLANTLLALSLVLLVLALTAFFILARGIDRAYRRWLYTTQKKLEEIKGKKIIGYTVDPHALDLELEDGAIIEIRVDGTWTVRRLPE